MSVSSATITVMLCDNDGEDPVELSRDDQGGFSTSEGEASSGSTLPECSIIPPTLSDFTSDGGEVTHSFSSNTTLQGQTMEGPSLNPRESPPSLLEVPNAISGSSKTTGEGQTGSPMEGPGPSPSPREPPPSPPSLREQSKVRSPPALPGVLAPSSSTNTNTNTSKEGESGSKMEGPGPSTRRREHSKGPVRSPPALPGSQSRRGSPCAITRGSVRNAPSSSTSITSNTGMQVQDSVADSFLRACKSGDLASVQRNSDQAELTATTDRHGNTGLILAAEYGQANIVSHLLQLDEDPLHVNAANEAGRTALMVAVDRGRRKVVEILLHHPSTIRSITDRFGITAQDIANLRQDARIVELLGGTPAPAIAQPAPPPARHEQSRELAANIERASIASTISQERRSLGRSPSHPLTLSVTPPPLPRSSGVHSPRRAKSTMAKEPPKDSEKQRIQRSRSRTRSLSRSIDETNEVKSDGITIKDGLLGDIISKIEAKIRNYEDMIEVERSSAPLREVFNETKKKKMTQLFTDINRERIQFSRKQIGEREKFNEKQRVEMEEFQREAQIRQDEIELELAAKEREVDESEQNIKNYEQTLIVLRAQQEHLSIDPLAQKKPEEPEFSQEVKEELECPVCLELMYPPIKIFQCGQGHALCGRCRPKCRNCPTCRGPIIGRATVLEKLAQSLLKDKDKEVGQ